MDSEKLIEQLNDFNENHIAVLCGSGQCACGYLCDKDDCIVVRASTALSTLQAENEKLRAELEQVKAERDAAVSDLTFAVNKYRLFTTDINLCYLCKFNFPSSGENEQTYECPGCYGDDCFEWRGQKKED